MSLDVTGPYRYPNPDAAWLARHVEDVLEPELPIDTASGSGSRISLTAICGSFGCEWHVASHLLRVPTGNLDYAAFATALRRLGLKRRSVSEDRTTLTLESAIAAPASSGRSRPRAAIGIPSVL